MTSGFTFFAIAAAVAGVAVLEIALPGRGVYHYGWFNVAIAALVATGLRVAFPLIRDAGSSRARAGLAACALGVAIVGIATAGSGLFGPDSRTIVGAPGTSVHVDELGASLQFPDAPGAQVLLARPGRAPAAVGASGRNAGSFVLRLADRPVASVEARDLRGNHLTITQPTGSVFLSPVLLFTHHQVIPQTNFDVPFDSFAVPAAHRLVKAVLFTPAQAMMLHPMAAGGRVPAVLFAVDDESDRPLPNSIGLAPDGQTVEIAGLRLRADVFVYPAVEVISVPAFAAVAAGVALLLAGAALAFFGGSAKVSEPAAP